MALWRETLLAQAVLCGKTRGYRNHPQLDRFKEHADPRAAISLYLQAVQAEAEARGYAFDKNKIRPVSRRLMLSVTSGQLEYEWTHLREKLRARSPEVYQRWEMVEVSAVAPHPLFSIRQGAVEPWERPRTERRPAD